MWKLVGGAIGGFLLFRDFFGYLLPGTAFVLLTEIALKEDVSEIKLPDPEWLYAAGLIAVCYLAGHVMVAIWYALFQVAQIGIHPIRELSRAGRLDAEAKELARYEELCHFRYKYPALFDELLHRDTMGILRIGLGPAMIVSLIIHWTIKHSLTGPVWFEKGWWFVGIAGTFMLINAGFGRRHIKRYETASLAAARKLEDPHKAPGFRWDGCCESMSGK